MSVASRGSMVLSEVYLDSSSTINPRDMYRQYYKLRNGVKPYKNNCNNKVI